MILDVIQAFERGARSAVATDVTNGASTPGLADQLIRDALTAGASDIHVDPLSARLRVRFRIDGVLVDQQELGKDVAPPLTSRLIGGPRRRRGHARRSSRSSSRIRCSSSAPDGPQIRLLST